MLLRAVHEHLQREHGLRPKATPLRAAVVKRHQFLHRVARMMAHFLPNVVVVAELAHDAGELCEQRLLRGHRGRLLEQHQHDVRDPGSVHLLHPREALGEMREQREGVADEVVVAGLQILDASVNNAHLHDLVLDFLSRRHVDQCECRVCPQVDRRLPHHLHECLAQHPKVRTHAVVAAAVRHAVVALHDLATDRCLQVDGCGLAFQEPRQELRVILNSARLCAAVSFAVPSEQGLLEPPELDEAMHHPVVEYVVLEEVRIVNQEPQLHAAKGLREVLGTDVQQKHHDLVDFLLALGRRDELADEVHQSQPRPAETPVEAERQIFRDPKMPSVHRGIVNIRDTVGEVPRPAHRKHALRNVNGLLFGGHVVPDVLEQVWRPQHVFLLKDFQDGLHENPRLPLETAVRLQAERTLQPEHGLLTEKQRIDLRLDHVAIQRLRDGATLDER
mmetsp:Transcript_63531/g.182431  ORF Transcript_63531/g.182431 Transcript_63531/m.182431 type:complete len:447 (+) Transcript_63531:435-1775(+)